jgi:hypothetical protein
MAFSQHTVIGGALVAVIVLASAAGLVITGGPGEARKEREDIARLQAIGQTAEALACYQQAEGDIPEDLSIVEAELSHASSEARRPSRCIGAGIGRDPVSKDHFVLTREAGRVTHICAEFATRSKNGDAHRYAYPNSVVPDLDAPRSSAGEHCFELNLTAELE